VIRVTRLYTRFGIQAQGNHDHQKQQVAESRIEEQCPKFHFNNTETRRYGNRVFCEA